MSETVVLKPPFPWFGGKSRVAPLVWERFGNVPNYVEPFFGSGAVLFHRPHAPKIETVNDKDALLANFWRALQHDPEQVAYYADNPVNENDLHARHLWLVHQKETLTARIEGDPEFYDAKIAGWWVWGICCWIGSGFCSGRGPWQQDSNRQLVDVGNAGQGVNRQRVHLGNAGQGVNRQREDIFAYLSAFAERLRNVRVCCGDWTRVAGETPTVKLGLTGVFLDPPYSAEAERNNELYCEENLTVAHDVRRWAVANGDNRLLRIALCGYDGEHEMPSTWQKIKWKARGGYGSQGNGYGRENVSREVTWFSPHCLDSIQGRLW